MSNTTNSLRNYEIRQKLGSGSYGVIYKVYNKIDKSMCVLKQISLTRMSEKARKNATNQAHIMGKLKHPFIVCYYQSFVQDNNLNILMEFCDSGDLSYYLKQQNKKFMKQEKIWKFFIQICMGLEHIHKNKILHRDIKTLNIFLNKNQMVKIGDLGVAKMLNAADFAHTMVGTPFYLSPQLCQQKPYNQKSDIWALGCLLYQLCTFRHPFEATNQASLILKIIRGKYEPIPEFYSRQLNQMIGLCLERDYKRRPTTNMILSKPNIKKMVEDFELNKIVNQFYSKNAVISQPVAPIKNDIKIPQNKDKPVVKVENKFSTQKPKKVLDEGIIEKPKPIKVLQQPKIQVKNPIKDNQIRQEKKQKQKKVEPNPPQNIFAKKRQSQPIIRNSEQKDEKKELFGSENKAQFISALQNKLKASPKKNAQPQKRQIIKKNPISFEIPWKGQNKKFPTQSNSNNNLEPQGKIVVHNKNALFSQPNLLNQKNSQVINKIKIQKKVEPKVYDNIKSQQKPIAIIKSGGFNQRPQTGLQRKKFQQQQHSNDKKNMDKIQQNKRQQKPVINSMKNIRKQSQERPSYLPKKQPQPQNLIPHYPPKLKKPSIHPQSSKHRPPPKNVPHPVKSTSSSRFTDLTKQQQDLVANLPDIVKKYKYNSNEQQNKQKNKIKFKQIDDDLVAKMYEQMLKSGRSQPNTNAHSNSQITNKKIQDNQQSDSSSQSYKQQQNIQQMIPQSSQIYNYPNKDDEQIVEQQDISQQNNNSNIYYQINKYQYQQSQPHKTSPGTKKHEWSYDQQPQLPLLQQTQTPLFQQANPYLVQESEQNQKTQQQILKDKREHLQIKLKQNIKRQDQINKLMQMKIQQCRSVVSKNFQEILTFFRSKINMDREYTEQDQKQVENFLAKRNLTDQRKFQNIYKIMHFQMELENTRRIIQSICKKLAELQK